MRSAVIDIGSNSIKLLVADGVNATPVFETIRETRLSPNTESARERIDDAAFSAGINAVCELFQIARSHAPEKIAVVGTSLFRTAENAAEFARAVEVATGTPMQILSGEEEAALVAAGVLTDERIRAPCAIFDLGGGSLEFIARPASSDKNVFEISWKLGAVRLSRKFFPDTKAPISRERLAKLQAHIREKLGDVLSQQIPSAAQIVFCGGAAGISERLLPELSASAMKTLLHQLCAGTLAERVALGVPEKRADIFPAALAVFTEICGAGNISRAVYTTRNLRYGLCAQLNSAAG